MTFNKLSLIILACLWFVSLTPVFAQSGKTVSITLDNFDTTAAWKTMRDQARMKAEYSTWDMTIDKDGRKGSCLRVSFGLIAPSADIWGSFNIEEPFLSLGIWVRNVADTPVTFTPTLVEKDGSMYVSKGVELQPNSQWQHLDFTIDTFTSAPWSSDENGKLDYPITRIVTAFSQVADGKTASLCMDELTITRPKPVMLKLKKLVTPASAKPGQKFRVAATVVPTQSVVPAKCEMLLMYKGAIQASADVTPRNWTVGKAFTLGPAEFQVPKMSWPGKHEIVFRMSNVRIAGRENGIIGYVNIPASRSRKMEYSVKVLNGTPQLFEGKNRIPATGFMYEFPNPDQVKEFAKAGVHLYFLECRQMGWVGNDKYDYKLIDELLAELFVCDPEARVVPFFYIDLAAPLVSPEIDWWQKEHPEDLCVDEHGNVFSRYEHQCVSFASENWRRDAGKAMLQFIKHLETSPYADRIVGYQPSAGGSYEWMYHGGQDGKFLDYSKPTQKAFRKWLTVKYAGDVNKLKKAWKQDSVTFETASIPLQADREKTTLGQLRDPQLEAPVIDYYVFLSELTVDTIDHFCGLIKKATNDKKLAGVFYGYVMEQMYGGFCTQHTGHFAMGKLLESKNVDFLMSPTSYWQRQAGSTGGLMTAMASVRLHKKLWINQADLRTHLSDPASGYGRSDTEVQSVSVVRREYAMDLTTGIPVYWYSFSQPWFGHSNSLMTSIKQMAKIEEQACKLDRSLTGDKLAVIVSDSPAAYLGLPSEPARSLVYRQREFLYRSGVPFDVYLDSDLTNPDMPKYKAYLFLDSIHMSENTRKVVEGLKSSNRVLAWVWGQGIAGATLDVGNVSKLTGVNCGLSSSPGIPTVKLLNDPQKWYGSEGEFAPLIFPQDSSAETLGVFSAPDALSGKPGLVVKRNDDWTSLFSGAPSLSPEVIREIAKLAGIHIYSTSNDPVYLSKDYIGIHAMAAGQRKITLPAAAKIVDCFTGKTVSEGSSEFTVDMSDYSTNIFQVVK